MQGETSRRFFINNAELCICKTTFEASKTNLKIFVCKHRHGVAAVTKRSFRNSTANSEVRCFS